MTCTLHPAPCKPAPCTCNLHPAPCTLHPATCNLQFTPSVSRFLFSRWRSQKQQHCQINNGSTKAFLVWKKASTPYSSPNEIIYFIEGSTLTSSLSDVDGRLMKTCEFCLWFSRFTWSRLSWLQSLVCSCKCSWSKQTTHSYPTGKWRNQMPWLPKILQTCQD